MSVPETRPCPSEPPGPAPAIDASGTCAAAAASYLPQGRATELLRVAGRAAELAQHLLAAPRAERLGMIAADAAYRRPELVLLLTLGAEERLDAPPPAAEEHAELALAVSLATAKPSPSAAEPRRLRGFCRWLLAKAQLRAGRLEDAEASLAAVDKDLAGGADAPVRALAAAGLAQLRWQQGRAPEAWAHFTAAARAFAEVGDAPAVGACRGLCGFLLLAAGEPMLARIELRAAHQALGRSSAPSLAVLVCLGVARCEAALGGTAAPDFLAFAREAASCLPPAPALGAWWNALLGLGRDPSDAELLASRRQALAGGDHAAAAKATLELAVRRFGDQMGSAIAGLVAPLAACGGDAAIWSEEIAALVPLVAARPEAYPGTVRELALRLAALTVARLGAHGLPWCVCDLADRLLLQRREDEQPIGAARGL